MTNYNLEDFKAWLEAESERKEGLIESWNNIFTFDPDYFQGFLEGHKGTAAYFKPYREIALKWKAEVDERNALLNMDPEQLRAKAQNLVSQLSTKTNKLIQEQSKAQGIQSQLTSLQTTYQQKQQRILALEADKQDLIQQLSQTKQKLQTYLTQEKSFLHREIQLIKEVLHD